MLRSWTTPKGLVWLPLPLFRSDQDQELREVRSEEGGEGGMARRQRVNGNNFVGSSPERLSKFHSAVRSGNPENRDGDVACQCAMPEKGERSIQPS